MARASRRLRRLWDTYSFAGFRAQPTVRGIFGDPKARVITLRRRSKNDVRVLWSGPDGLVRPQGPSRARSVVRGHADIPGAGGAAPRLPQLRQGEEGAARLSGGQSALHQALRLLCRATLPAGFDRGRGEGAGAGLAHGQGAGDAVHGGPARARGQARPTGDRDRRDRDPQGAYLSDRGRATCGAAGRSGSAATTARRRAWPSSTPGWARGRARAFVLR